MRTEGEIKRTKYLLIAQLKNVRLNKMYKSVKQETNLQRGGTQAGLTGLSQERTGPFVNCHSLVLHDHFFLNAENILSHSHL